MVQENLINFLIVIIVQLIFFLIHAYAVGEMSKVKKYLLKGMVIGLPFGVACDLLFGHAFGLWNYELGYTWWFLTINGIFSYGFMFANIFLLYHHSLKHFYFWSVGVGIAYEVANYLFPVWEWTFGTPVLEYLVIVIFAYTLISVGMMATLKLFYCTHFRLLPF
jgi:hypothetical protein